MKRIIFIVVMIVLALGSVAHGRTYKIATVPWIGWSPINVADAKGFWKDLGIDVRVVTLPDPIAVQSLFKNKLVDIKFDMIGSAAGCYMDGVPITVIAETDWSHGGDELIIKKDMDVSKLKGSTIGVYLNQPPVMYFINKYLSTIGLKLSDVRIVEMETKALADHFIADRLKAIACYDPDALRAERDGNGKLVVTSAAYEGCIPEGMMALRDVLKNIPRKDIAKILKGWIRAVKWIQDENNWEEYVKIMNSHTFKDDTPYSENYIRQMLDTARIHDVKMQLERNQDGGGLITYLNDLRVFLKENKMLRKDFNPTEIFDNKVIMEVLKNEN
ncbi:ABC transporter substrate-binding protein [Desulfonema magnum]|uniref:NMT1/THI5 like domain-containing protein n=1 Tax=Desulfonema magnum TaxID=45655 RepID=A0A975BKW1_9BACT|nr:ABC transporter substrate-binding protein [Desulfonema magnum]QTA87376.1 NMT1/THI5 like domain-containing protein [Desulfonema magnum]